MHRFRCLSLQLAAEKKTPKTVHLEVFFGPSYFETALVTQLNFDLPPLVWVMIAFTLNQQMEPLCISIWGVALDAGDFKLIIE